MLFLPFPGVLEELFARKVFFLYAFRFQLGHHLVFSGYRSMVGARHPACVLSVHSGLSDQDIVQSVVQDMAHVQYACDIRRRNDYGIGFPCIRLRVEELVFQPVCVPFVFSGGRIVFCGQFHNNTCFSINRAKIASFFRLRREISPDACRPGIPVIPLSYRKNLRWILSRYSLSIPGQHRPQPCRMACICLCSSQFPLFRVP